MLDFAVSPALVESACSNIADWGPPEIGIKELPFLGEILEVHMSVAALPPVLAGLTSLQTAPQLLPAAGPHVTLVVQARPPRRVQGDPHLGTHRLLVTAGPSAHLPVGAVHHL